MVYVASIHMDLDSLSRDLDILCNIFPIPIYVLVIIYILQSYKPVWF